MDKRGQMTIEGILLFGFFIFIFVSVTFPAAMSAYRASKDASFVLDAKNNLNIISNAIDAARIGGAGSIKTIYISSNNEKWKLEVHDTDFNKTMIYWVGWSSSALVPSELLRDSIWGGVYITSMSGIGSGTQGTCQFLSGGTGRWKVKVENNATSASPTINISTCSTGLITITLVG